MGSRKDRSSRTANPTASNVFTAGDDDKAIVSPDDLIVRCSRCHLPLSAPRSVARELGPKCALIIEGVAA